MARDDLVFSAVRCRRTEIEEYYEPDCPFLEPEEIRAISSFMLALTDGVVAPYPSPTCLMLVDDGRPLDHGDTLAAAERLLRGHLEAAEYPIHLYILPPSPRCAGGANYEFRDWDEGDDPVRIRSIYEAIDSTDSLLIRGLGALIKGQMLHRHEHFHAEACSSLYIAMEASFGLVQDELGALGRSPSAEEAALYIAEVFDEDVCAEKYFSDFYEARIKTVHPRSRYGTFPDAPLEADDFFDLYQPLVAIFRYFATGWVEPPE